MILSLSEMQAQTTTPILAMIFCPTTAVAEAAISHQIVVRNIKWFAIHQILIVHRIANQTAKELLSLLTPQ